MIKKTYHGREYMELGGETYVRCTKCNSMLPLSEYHKNKTGWMGRYSICSNCTNLYIGKNKITKDGLTYTLNTRGNKKKTPAN